MARFKKHIKLVLLLIVCSGLIPSCCDHVVPFIELSSVSHELYADEELLESSTVSSSEVLKIKLEFLEFEYVAEAPITLTNSCLAVSCEPDGHMGLKTKISSIDVVSNNPFLTYSPGESLIEEFSSQNVLFSTEDTDLENNTVNELMAHFNEVYGFPNSGYLVLDNSPSNEYTHEFTIQVELENGVVLETTTSEIQFN